MDEPQAAFKAGLAGMHIDGSFRIGSLNKIRGLEWGVAELPANGAAVAAEWAVSKKREGH